jgi:hypothetical protein
MAQRSSKAKSTKKTADTVWSDSSWTVVHGELKRGTGRPRKTEPLFRVVAEKVPFEALAAVRRHLKETGVTPNGVYVAHDSMGVARYVGRGRIFQRLKTRYRANPQELRYFSFYVVLDKAHEREIETLLIRSAGPQLHFNTRKKRVDIQPGNIRDYEPGTVFYERRYRRGGTPAALRKREVAKRGRGKRS